MEESSVKNSLSNGGRQLCKVASLIRAGLSCNLHFDRLGGFNIIFEVVFEDQVRWLASIPLATSCHQPEEITPSHATTLKYLKTQTELPIPHVYHYAVASDPRNPTGVSYVLIQRLPGKPLPVIESLDLEPSMHELSVAKRVHQQLADIVIELATLKFDKIGTFREDSHGGFFIAAFADITTANPKRRTSAYTKDKKGPFRSVSEFYNAMSDLNDLYTNEAPESEDEDEQEVDEVLLYQQLREIAPSFIVDGFNNGPFVIHHDDLTTQNILVDDDFEITGIIDFPGTVVPLPSLCVYPWLFRDNTPGPVAYQETYLDVFLNRDTLHTSSALASKSVRAELMQEAFERQDFELGLMRPYTSLVVPRLLEYVRERETKAEA